MSSETPVTPASVTPALPSPSAFTWLRNQGHSAENDGAHARALFAYIEALQRHSLSVAAEVLALRDAGSAEPEVTE